MSLCIRTISSKLPTTVCTRIQIAQLDRQLQNVQNSKLSSGSTSRDYALNLYRPALPSLNSLHRYFDDRLSALKLQNLKDSHVVQRSNLKSIPCSTHKGSYVNNPHQRNNNKLLDQNNVLGSYCLLSNQTELKEKNSNELNNSMLHDFTTGSSENDNSKREGRPSVAQIEKIKDNLAYNLPRFFVTMMDYHIYTPDIIFVNNLRGTTTKSFTMYYLQMALLKIYAHIKFVYVKMHILKITSNPEDDSVKVRWQITGISGMKMVTKLFKFGNPFKIKDAIGKYETSWYDGFSTFYINSEGKVYKHVVDKIIPDSERIEDKKSKLKIPVKLAICLGITNLDFFNARPHEETQHLDKEKHLNC